MALKERKEQYLPQFGPELLEKQPLRGTVYTLTPEVANAQDTEQSKTKIADLIFAGGSRNEEVGLCGYSRTQGEKYDNCGAHLRVSGCHK